MKDTNENIHEDHRERMRQKYEAYPDSMPDHEILEMLLFHVIPRKNTNPIAHALLRQFGSLRGVFDADITHLMLVEGVGEKTAKFIKEVRYMWRRTEMSVDTLELMDTYDKIVRYFTVCFSGETNEVVYVMLLDSQARMIACKKFSEGDTFSSIVDMQKLATFALVNHSRRVILAHNHPSGNPEPSHSDTHTTRHLQRSLESLHINLIEHFVIAGNKYSVIIDKSEK